MKQFVLTAFLVCAAFALKAQINPRDTVMPDTTQLVPIHVMPMDTPAHHNMPVVDPLAPDTMKRNQVTPRKPEN